MSYDVLVADDHAIIRGGLKKILADTGDLNVAGEASNGSEALQMIRSRDWSVAILDISMPGRSGLELIKLIKSERPKLPLLIFSMHQEEQYAVRVIRAGASGYLSKEGDSDLIVPAVRKVAQGGVFISPKVAELLALDTLLNVQNPSHTSLSDREFDVFFRIVRGESLTNIANSLSLSVKTVSTHKSHILHKMCMSKDVDLVRYAVEHNLLDPLN
jgi:two-component system, NarL family, invasion response regulator UvrY